MTTDSGEGRLPEEEAKPAQEEADALRAQIEQVTQQRDAAQEEAKKHQVNVSKKADELAKRQAVDDEIAYLKSQSEVMTAMMADLVDRGSEEEPDERPKRRRSEEYLSRLTKQSESKKKEDYDQFVKKVGTYQAEVEALGLTESDDNYLIIRAFTQVGDFEAADARIAQIRESKKTEAAAPKASEEEKASKYQEDVKEAARKMLAESGQMVSETGEPSTSGGLAGLDANTLKEKMKDREWFKEHEAEIDQLHKGGKFTK